ncbi:hypothetical protein D3C86_1275980 [compost metagenome]
MVCFCAKRPVERSERQRVNNFIVPNITKTVQLIANYEFLYYELTTSNYSKTNSAFGIRN